MSRHIAGIEIINSYLGLDQKEDAMGKKKEMNGFAKFVLLVLILVFVISAVMAVITNKARAESNPTYISGLCHWRQ